MKQKIVNIDAVTLPDSWFQLVYNALEYGRDFKIDQGSFAGSTRKEFDFIVVHITRPFERDVNNGLPLIPIIPETMEIPAPVTEEYLIDYAPYLLGSEMRDNESYTYGQRLNKEPMIADEIVNFFEKPEIYKQVPKHMLEYCEFRGHTATKEWKSIKPGFFSQIEEAIWTYKNGGHRNNQMCLQVAKPKDMTLLDPPCLRHIDTRIQDGKLHFYPYFRSWDLWSGYPANLAGISMLQEHMAGEIGVEQGEMICTSKGLHLYDTAVPFAKMRCMIEEKAEEQAEEIHANS